jgi:D-glycero-D-manno-heptose 1,7-bisphosphate phosphatase
VALASWVLLDRDGTINVGAPEGDYITDAAQVRLLPRAGAAVARLNGAGLPVAVVSNQRGVALGLMSEADLEAVNGEVRAQLATHGARLDAILCCVHHLDSCECRKPRTGMLEQAGRQLGMVLEKGVIVGDSEADVQAGRGAGTYTIRLGGSGTETAADLLVATLWDAVGAILC